MDMTLESRAALDFVLTLRKRWADTLYPKLRAEFDAEDGRDNAPEAIADRVQALPGYPGFAWLERGSQKMLWRAAMEAAGSAPIPQNPGPAALELDPGLALPDWYTEWDIHLQPGGVWSDAAAARVYELGAKLVMLGDNDDYKFHRLFVETAIPRRVYRRIVDLGCGFGKSTWPLKKAFPHAEVIGIDLARPCLELAAERASAQGLPIRFRQADATATGLEGGAADLVTSTMLIHELPLPVLADLFVEAARLLAPGGLLRFLDFQKTGDAFRDLAMEEHGARNNEPFLPPMMAADTAAMAEAAGFTNVRWTAFDEREAGRLPRLAWPARAEWHFPWAVLEAEKP
ncbi:MAG TPA: class I SAM-dependent methyltransferase [Alphaproteobacteria bacterium]|nr:class I SAM-dependent methyltransferase [Alphaproteobacteria bacterium]